MEYKNAFIGKGNQPTEAEVAAALGPTAALWDKFIHWMAEEKAVSGQEWKGVVVNKYGWSLRLKQKSRNIIYLGPGNGCFVASFVLSDKAVEAAKKSHLTKSVQDALAAAPRYPEGNGVRLLVHRASDLLAVRKIAEIKMTS